MERPAIPDLRVMVISTSLRAGANALWEGAASLVAELVLVGAEGTADRMPWPSEAGVLALPELDVGRGLIWRHLRGVRRAVRDFRPHLVHVNGELWSVTVQELLGIGVPVIPHGAENLWKHGGPLEQVARASLVRRAVRRSAGYMSWNHAGVDYVKSLARPNFPTCVMPAIIPPQDFRDSPWVARPGTGDCALEILLVGRLVPLKGFDTVIRAAALLNTDRIRLTVCGDGPAQKHLVGLAQTLGVRLDVRGQVSPADLARLMSRSSCLVQPSVSTPDLVEQFGRSVAEAMTVGLPCIVSDSGELPMVVGQDKEAIFPEGDHVALAEILRGALEKPQRLVDLSHRQRLLASAYTPARGARTVTDFWAQAVESSRS